MDGVTELEVILKQKTFTRQVTVGSNSSSFKLVECMYCNFHSMLGGSFLHLYIFLYCHNSSVILYVKIFHKEFSFHILCNNITEDNNCLEG
jgi:hypothetical protein